MLYFLLYFVGDVDAALSQCLLAVQKPTMLFKLFTHNYTCTVVGKVCSREGMLEDSVQYRGAEEVLACIAATQYRILPTLCVAF